MGADQLAIRVGEIAGSLTESSNKLREAGDHSAAGLRAARDELELGVRNGINVIADDEGRECSTFPDRFWFSGSGEWPNGMPQPDCDPNQTQQGRLARRAKLSARHRRSLRRRPETSRPQPLPFPRAFGTLTSPSKGYRMRRSS